jgi:hypothetical protein
MLKYVVITSELPGDALVLVGEYDTVEEAQTAADQRTGMARAGTVTFIVESSYFARQTEEPTPEPLPS